MRLIFLSAMVAALPLAGLAAEKPAAKNAQLERGKYIVWSSACNDCHTPKKMGPHGLELDETRLLAGQPEFEKLPPPPTLPPGPWIVLGS